MPDTFNSLLLKKAHEARLDTLLGGAASLKFGEFFQFVLDRCMVNNRVPLTLLLDLFLEALQSKESATEHVITKEQIVFLLNQLGKFLFPGDKHFQDKVFNEILSDKKVANKDSKDSRVMNFHDEVNRRLVSEPSLRVFKEYSE